MSLNQPLANIMSKMLNAERRGLHECVVGPFSTKAQRVLEILKAKGYIADFKILNDSPGGEFLVQLAGKINQCGVISPNFNVKKGGYTAYEKRFLPAQGFGILIVTTTQGIMDHREAQAKGLGGRLLGYCY